MTVMCVMVDLSSSAVQEADRVLPVAAAPSSILTGVAAQKSGEILNLNRVTITCFMMLAD